MEHVRLGRSNLTVSRIGLGAMGIGDPAWRPWVLDEDAARPLVRRALELGVNLFDTCDFYSSGTSEIVVGRLLRELGADRDDIVIATKLGNPMGAGPNRRGYSRKHILAAADASLRRLGVDHIDLLQTHIWDPTTDIEEMVGAFDDLVRAGKVRYVGAADMPAWQLAKAVYLARATGRAAFATFTHHYNAVWREDEREHLPFCDAEGLGTLPYSPSARGFLADPRGHDRKTTRAGSDGYAEVWYGRDTDTAVQQALCESARIHGVEPAQLAIAWVLAHRRRAAAIVGATSVAQLEAAVAATQLDLSDAIGALDELYAVRPSSGHS